MNLCELCDSDKGIRRSDNIHVCNECINNPPTEGETPNEPLFTDKKSTIRL